MKILADECIGPKTTRIAADLLARAKPNPITLVHWLDKFTKEEKRDDKWAEILASDGGWIVLTKDTGQKKRGPPLQLILPRKKVTGIFFTRGRAQASGFEALRAVIWLIHDIEAALSEPAGTRFKIYVEGRGYSLQRWSLTDREKQFVEGPE